MKLFLLVIIAFFSLLNFGFCQQLDSLHFLDGVAVDGDTLPHKNLQVIPVFPKPVFKSKRYERRYYRLERRVKKVYPYAVKAGELLKKYELDYLVADASKGKRRRYVKQVEKELFEKYGPQLKKLSISEGRILIKLIDRQTGNNSYALIKDLKGGFTALFWQGIARLFGSNLKDEYDPVLEDLLIEKIISKIEAEKRTLSK